MMQIRFAAACLAATFACAAGAALLFSPDATGQTKKKTAPKRTAFPALAFPPKLPDGKNIVTATTAQFLKGPATIGKDVLIAKTAPTVDFMYYPCQTYPGKIWSNWGDGLAVNGKYYSSLGDHDAPQGNAFVYEYDPAKKTLRVLVNVAQVLMQIMGYYVPGKIHGRLDLGSDGMLYFSTHRGSAKVTTDEYHYQGDWIIRCDPKSGKSEVVAHGPVPKHCIPNSVLDPDRLIFYGGTAAGSGSDNDGVQFFAFDVKNKKVLYSGPDGPPRYMIFARSTGNIYYVPGRDGSEGAVMRYAPGMKAPEKIDAALGLRSATQETPQGYVYTVSKGFRGQESILYSFNTKTEKAENLGPAAVGTASYITSIDADPTGRYLYYIPGAHGGADVDGTAVVQFDTKTRQKKVIAFLHPFFKDEYGATLVGTFSTAVDPQGDKLYVTWNVNRGSRAWDSCGLMVIHIPESERQP